MPDNDLPSTSNGVGTPINEISAYPLAKLLKGVEKSYDKGKKLLEESKKHSAVFLYMRKIITPEQMSLLSQPNSDQYPSDQELSDANVDNSSETAKDSGEKFGNVILTELKKDGKNFIVAVKTVMQPRKGGVS